jgi:hypothetical protein
LSTGQRRCASVVEPCARLSRATPG